MSFLLDTNVVSELRKAPSGRANVNVVRWADRTPANEQFISIITVSELELGILLLARRDPEQARLHRVWLDEHVLPAFGDRVLHADVAVAKRFARLHVPDPRPLHDAYIAATALVHGFTVVSRNVTDFEPMGVAVINPWLRQR